MNTIEIAARNYAANTTGLSPEMINLMFATTPEQAQPLYETVSAFVNGPYGSLVPADALANEPNYGDALDDVVDLIDSFVMDVPCECSAYAVHAALQSLKAGIDVLGQDDDEQLDLPLGIQELLTSIFGPNVKIVSVEQAQG